MLTADIDRVELSFRDGWWAFAKVIGRGDHFTISTTNLRTEPYLTTYGQLPAKYQPRVCLASYVIYSYETPIAWFDSEEKQWYMPEVKYSVTTTHHQNIILVALCDVVGNFDLAHLVKRDAMARFYISQES